jgi:hypothetical protein
VTIADFVEHDEVDSFSSGIDEKSSERLKVQMSEQSVKGHFACDGHLIKLVPELNEEIKQRELSPFILQVMLS